MSEPVNKNLYALLRNHQAPNTARKPIICLEGSARSGKTWSWIEYCINYCAQHEGTIVSVFRCDAATHERGAIRDFKQLVVNNKYKQIWIKGRWNGQSKTFTFSNGSVLEFVGTNDPAKLHGPERDIAVLNEAMEIKYDSYTQIAARTRLLTILDWNPSFNRHWVFDRIMQRDDVLYIHSTYKDNPHLSSKQIDEIERTNPDNPENVRQGTADKWFWEVYGLGKRGRREGAIFKAWDLTDDWPDPMMCQRWGYGLDYGFSLDPTALVECALFQDRLYLRQHLYERELIAQHNYLEPHIPSIEGRLRELQIPEHARIHADNARPEINYALTKSGFKMVTTKKSPDSILSGIDRLRTYPFMVHRSSQDLQMELEGYVWDKNAAGEYLDRPVDRDNHLIDAARYWALGELNPQRSMYSNKRRRSAIAKSNLVKWR